jgi:decaprenylphospho-beta-D-ribofuranose 2-oxidase
VLPGTAQVTLGGALAADVHGKNHHVAGSLGHHVAAVDLVLPGGELRRVTPAGDPALFWATAGGMGLTGVVVGLRLRLRPAPSAWVLADTWRAADLDDLLRLLVEAERRFGYAVAWIDVTAPGRRFGRGVVSAADHAGPGDVPRRSRRGATVPATARLSPAVPATPPLGLVNRTTIRAFNEAWYRAAPRRRARQPQPASAFFTPLDGVAQWNRLYGRSGFVQYQLVVPDERALRDALALVRRARLPSFLTVLKRFGPAAPGPLSFPRPGWTLACDVPATVPGLGAALDELDELVAGAGGRVYLAKDARLRPDLLAAMYPRVGELRALLDRVDPARTMASDLARRLSL